MFDEFALLRCFEVENLDQYVGNAKHPYINYDPKTVTYHTLPLSLILRSLLFKDGLDFASMPPFKREEVALQARKVLLAYLGEDVSSDLFKEETKKWKGGAQKLATVLFKDDPKALKKAKDDRKKTILALRPEEGSIFDISVTNKQRDKIDFFCFDGLLAVSLAQGRLCRYGFKFTGPQLADIKSYYAKSGYSKTQKAKHFLTCLYVYALQSNSPRWAYTSVQKRDLGMVIGVPDMRKSNAISEFLIPPSKSCSPVLEMYQAQEGSESKAWAFSFLGYESWGNDPENEIVKWFDEKPYSLGLFDGFSYFPSYGEQKSAQAFLENKTKIK